MNIVEPKVFLVGETKIIDEGLAEYLNHVGAPNWKTDAPSDGEKLVEVMGRLCYRSFEAGLNPNVTRVREGNNKYLGHVLDVGHGSVTEHATLNFIFADVSRVFTHELVRHRQGVAISQESLRYVRLDKLSAWIPSCIQENPFLMKKFDEVFSLLEQAQGAMAELTDIDNIENFGVKKTLTSAFRRIAPIGLATSIGWSCNIRALRHVIEMRTERVAEEEIRLVFGKVYEIVSKRYPNFFGDYTVEMVDGLPEVKTKNRKV